MGKKQKLLVKTLKLSILIVFIVGTMILGVYPVKNQNVTVILEMETGTVSKNFTADEISKMTDFSINIPNVGDNNLKEIRLYRRFRSVCVDKIQSKEFERYITKYEDTLVFNNSVCDMLRQQSNTFFLERMIYMEILLAGVLALWIMITAFEEKFDPMNRDNHGPLHEIGRFIVDLKNYRQFIFYAAKADLKAEVANSYLNRLWWLLEPMFNMLVYVIVFGRIMGNSIQNYSTYVFSALLMWNFFSKTINYSVKCVRSNRDIVTKVYIPKHVLLISNMVLNFYKLLFSLIVLVPMLIIFRVHVGICALWLIPAYVVMILFAFGIGMILLHYGVYIDDLSYAVGILLQMTMFLSGIFYDVIKNLSVPLNVMMLSVNPVAMFVDTMRNALLNNYISNMPLIGIWILLSLLLCYLGVHIVYKNENGYVKVV